MKRKSQGKIERLSLAALSVAHGKRVRLWRLLYGGGPRNGTLVVLPLDQGLEHGPTDFFPNPAALDTDYQFRLAVEGNYSAIALGVGLAETYMKEYCGRVPLILKLSGKTNIPEDAEAVSPGFASVEDAVRLGADAVGYTMYVGTPRQDVEIREFQRVRQDCERLGMARVAEEMGADVVKLHEPTADHDRTPEPYRSLREDGPARVRRVVRSAGRVLVLFSGGEKDDRDERVVDKVRLYMEAGATGVMFGRNMWLRKFDHAVALTRRVHQVMARYPR